MNFKVKAKVNGKFWTFGQIKEGKFGPQLSFKVTPELKKLVMDAGDWLNFSLFEDDGEKPKTVSADTERQLAALKQEGLDSDTIPF